MELERNMLPLLFVLTGALNILMLKWSNILGGQCADGEWRPFQHPAMQTFVMFSGQSACFMIYKIAFAWMRRRGTGAEADNFLTRGSREFSIWSLLLPALVDALATLLLCIGLYLTYSSSFQMVRGGALIFAGIFSAMYLNQPLICRHWMAFITIACGLFIVMSVDAFDRVEYDVNSLPAGADSNSILTGHMLVLCAQVLHAAQYVYEERLIKSHDMPPLLAVGWRGLFGMAFSGVFLLLLNFVPNMAPLEVSSHHVVDDFLDLFQQLQSNAWLSIALTGVSISSACYSFAGVSLVKFSSTANRLLADTLIVVIVWVAALLLNWEFVNLLSVMGFIVIQMGVVAYRNAIFLDLYRSLLARMARGRYADVSVDTAEGEGRSVARNQAADVI